MPIFNSGIFNQSIFNAGTGAVAASSGVRRLWLIAMQTAVDSEDGTKPELPADGNKTLPRFKFSVQGDGSVVVTTPETKKQRAQKQYVEREEAPTVPMRPLYRYNPEPNFVPASAVISGIIGQIQSINSWTIQLQESMARQLEATNDEDEELVLLLMAA